MEPQDLAGALWRQRALVLIVFVVTGVAVTLGVLVAPKTYTATAVLSATASAEQQAGSEDLDSLRGTIAELANSAGVTDDVSAMLSAERTSDELRREIRADAVGGTVLIQIVVKDSDPEVAAEIANLVAERLPFYDPTVDGFLFTTTRDAEEPLTYSSPNLLLAAGVGLVLAVVLACVAASARDRRRATVDNGRLAEESAAAPLLAHVSMPRDPTALPALYPGTAAADAFRHLRVSLEAEVSADPVDLIVVGGLGGGDIEIWLGANLAISLANVGRRVLLVDARMGGSGSGSAMGDAPDTLGLYDVLGGADFESALSPGPVERLSVLPSGQGPRASVEALTETDFGRVMAQARESFDIVVVLPPPMDLNDDARVMATGGSLLLALPENAVSVAALRMHSERVRSVGARLLGVVLVGRNADRIAV